MQHYRPSEMLAFTVGLVMQLRLHSVHDIDHTAELRHELAEVSLKCTGTPAGLLVSVGIR